MFHEPKLQGRLVAINPSEWRIYTYSYYLSVRNVAL
jgi:hypothetical protein